MCIAEQHIKNDIGWLRNFSIINDFTSKLWIRLTDPAHRLEIISAIVSEAYHLPNNNSTNAKAGFPSKPLQYMELLTMNSKISPRLKRFFQNFLISLEIVY